MNELELYHHGIIGMRWGVRRYQNKGGSYTKRGLEHYRDTERRYKEADANFKSTKARYKYAKATKRELNEAYRAKKQAKKDLSQNYDELKKDYRADKGKELYKSGVTMSSIHRKRMSGLSVAIGGRVAANMLSACGKDTYASVIASTSAISGLAVFASTFRDARNLRAYYAHSPNYA